MDPLHAEGPGWRALLGAAIPVLLTVLIVPESNTRGALHAVARSHPKAVAHVSVRASPLTFTAFQEGDDLRAYVERARSHLDDPQTMYHVSQALEECRTWGWTADDDKTYAAVSVISYVDMQQWKRSGASEALAAPCRGFEGRLIDSREILALLQEAARQGEPHARARMLTFRDIAAPKSDVIPSLPALLATGDPQVVRDVGAFLARGEVSLHYGGEDVDASTAAIAWELAACDMGYPCGPMSRLVLAVCAFRGYCDDYRYDDAIAHDEGPERMAQAQRLRGDLVYALRRQDWSWLGLTVIAGG